VVVLPEGEAVLTYDLEPGGTMNILSTVVPAAARGNGVGGVLVRAALEWARATGRPVIPSCWFVGTWVGEHPEYRDLLTPE
jgi:predicted GNAT family acetyltransferase